ncbi:MAG: hypothetical protein UGF45_04090 [Massilioclostridium sp.]|nr:hypothetical protein [Massilioclostridium sp.]MEE1491207.1 hypothetical protein [Massilioclostridium sp.]
MALKQTVVLKSGLIVSDGYWKITTLESEDKKTGENNVRCKAEIKLYKDQPTLAEGKSHILIRNIFFDYDITNEQNIFEQAYTAAKQDERFIGSLDC